MSKKRWRLKPKVKIVLILFILIIISGVIFIYRKPIMYLYQSKKTGYKYETIKLINKYDVYNKIKNHEYSLNFEKIINTNEFKDEYVNNYLDIEYRTSDYYFLNINKLLALGYNSLDINTIYDVLNDEDINIVLNNKYLEDLVNILKLSYFKKGKLSRYINYSKDNVMSYKDIVTYVNIGLDNEFYTNVITVNNPEDISVLVNKYHVLENNYEPKDLEKINDKYNKGTYNQLRKVVKESFESMCVAALKDDVKIYSGSAYRPYSYQASLYNRYVNTDGKAKADTYAARAGYSEHQTGLAIDIMNAKGEFLTSTDIEFDWLIRNSYKYGFILRYPNDKENITGYMAEDWHFRYVGKGLAKVLFDGNITLDEYAARQ